MKFAPFFIYFTVISLQVNAQHQLGISTSNYGGTNSLFLNPANISDSPYDMYIQLGGTEGYITNNYVSWDAPYSIMQYATKNVDANYLTSNGKVGFNNTYLKEKISAKPYMAHIGGELRGPSIMFNSKNNCNSFGITSRLRGALNATQFDATLARYIKQYGLGRDYIGLGGIRESQFDINANGFHELGFSYGKTFTDDNYRIKIGLTAKYLTGLMNGHIISDNFDFEQVDDPAAGGNNNFNSVALLIKNANIKYGYDYSGLVPNWLLNNEPLYSQTISGHGAGFDIGFIYEKKSTKWKNHKQTKYGLKNNYGFKISVSAVDIGLIRYATDKVKSYDVNTNNVLVQNSTLKKIINTSSLFETMNTLLGQTNPSNFYNSLLPTSFVLSLDKRIGKNLYLNALLIQNMKASNKIGMMQQNILALTPRFESRYFDLSTPISFNNYSNLQFGVGSRIGPLYFGSDNLLGILTLNNPKGIEGYFGVALPIYSKATKIKDCWTIDTEKRFFKSKKLMNKKR